MWSRNSLSELYQPLHTLQVIRANCGCAMNAYLRNLRLPPLIVRIYLGPPFGLARAICTTVVPPLYHRCTTVVPPTQSRRALAVRVKIRRLEERRWPTS